MHGRHAALRLGVAGTIQKAQSNQQTTAAYMLDRLARWVTGGQVVRWGEMSVRRDTTRPLDAQQREDRTIALCKGEMDGSACAILTARDMAASRSSPASSARNVRFTLAS